jgi:hypothetical protein
VSEYRTAAARGAMTSILGSDGEVGLTSLAGISRIAAGP